MPRKRKNMLPAQGTSDPQGPAGGGGVVPASPPSSSYDGLPRESRVGSWGAWTTAPPDWWEHVASNLLTRLDITGDWREHLRQIPLDGRLGRVNVEELRIYMADTECFLGHLETADLWIREGLATGLGVADGAGVPVTAPPSKRDAIVEEHAPFMEEPWEELAALRMEGTRDWMEFLSRGCPFDEESRRRDVERLRGFLRDTESFLSLLQASLKREARVRASGIAGGTGGPVTALPSKRDVGVGTCSPRKGKCVSTQTEGGKIKGGQLPLEKARGARPSVKDGPATSPPQKRRRPSRASEENGACANGHPQRGKGDVRPPSPRITGGGLKLSSSKKKGPLSPPLNRGKKRTYAEAAGALPAPGKALAHSLAGDSGSPSAGVRRTGTRKGTTIRVPVVGDMGLLGLGTGDCIIMVLGSGRVSPGGKVFPPRRTRNGARPRPSSLPHAHTKREGGGGDGYEGSTGVASRASPAAARCYRCLMPGHLAAQCRGTDRRQRCYRCGANFCRWKWCLFDPPKCPLCVDMGGSAEHVLGSRGCYGLPPNRRKRGRHKGGREEDESSPPPDSGVGTGSSALGSGG